MHFYINFIYFNMGWLSYGYGSAQDGNRQHKVILKYF